MHCITHIHTRTHARTHTQTLAHSNTHTHRCRCMQHSDTAPSNKFWGRRHTLIDIHTYAHTRTNTPTHTRAHTHTQVWSRAMQHSDTTPAKKFQRIAYMDFALDVRKQWKQVGGGFNAFAHELPPFCCTLLCRMGLRQQRA
jgi:hypothetical protein